ncbi:MAG: sigma-70 family RNA polymerase sigma factor [Salibacteraceae bacterium]|jgi:RNA polymerase sigma-70 factor, ECF subfamily|nr:sigma-70 family RNA polymerase sigma factor [Salibacteraceae bacterium]MDP4763098.1 sigma-70 family RNA polymerase sigma factor [Salibacteraceae bacterium]MDP4964834.1 sigma-70 family RNA polymerase sigma factor [Salibacteraceae bacterium]
MLNKMDDDRLLVSQYLAGNEAAFEILLRKHKDRVYGYIKMMVKDGQLAEDIFQDVFVKAVLTMKRGQYNEEGKFLPWVLRIAHNLVIDTFRKNKRFPTVDGGEDFDIFNVIKDDGKAIDEVMIEDQIHTDINKLIEFLPDEQKEVLKLRHFSEMSFKEIAEETNVSINTALGRMRYALINLRKLIEEHNIALAQ